MTLLVVLPTYNEKPNLERVAAGILAHDFTRLLVVDDASPDGTGEIADRLAAESGGRVEVMHRRGPRGLGLAYIDGLRHALRHALRRRARRDHLQPDKEGAGQDGQTADDENGGPEGAAWNTHLERCCARFFCAGGGMLGVRSDDGPGCPAVNIRRSLAFASPLRARRSASGTLTAATSRRSMRVRIL